MDTKKDKCLLMVAIIESSNYNKELPSFSRESSDINSSHTYSARELEYIVMYDFITNEDDQLDCKKGTIIQVDPSISQMEDGWWFATSLDDYKSGWVPINYCKSL
jgi:hypothetical protein